MTVLQALGLMKSFGPIRALDGLDLRVREGEVLALLGPTGAGKTTTLRTIAGLEVPDAGKIILDEEDVTSLSPRERDVAVVFERFNLLSTMSVRDNIAFPLRSPVYRQDEDEITRRVATAAADLRIDHLLDRDTDQLSGGERQRVAIARALVRRPRVFLLDEPLSALDLKLRESLQSELKHVHESYGATVVYASHDFPSAAMLADRIALIEQGRIVQVDSLSRLIADPRAAAVGRLIGSPAMAQFRGSIEEGRLCLDDIGVALSCELLGLGTHPRGGVILGVWPEDIALGDGEGAGFVPARVWATDFRGADRVIEIHCGPHRFRKAVPRSMTVRQGDPIAFSLRPERCFVYDAKTGRRQEARP